MMRKRYENGSGGAAETRIPRSENPAIIHQRIRLANSQNRENVPDCDM